jgi:tripartite-type tricarboxylate transporter receptor subunit TctC
LFLTLPTDLSTGHDFKTSSRQGFAPKDMPADIVSKLNNEITAGLADPKIKERLADLGGEAKPMTPAEFGKLITDETEKWAKVIRAANIKLK